MRRSCHFVRGGAGHEELIAVAGRIASPHLDLPSRRLDDGERGLVSSVPLKEGRQNDVLFPPIRDHLVDRGIAVASFDKRGVGESDGDWLSVGIDTLADDALVELDALRALDGVPNDQVGLFGHSQGGWVIVEAAARSPQAAFAITHSGPGVSVAEQDRFAVCTALLATGATDPEVGAALDLYEEGMRALHDEEAWEEFVQHRADPRLASAVSLLDQARYAWPTFDDRDLLGRILDHDPAPALRRIQQPVLAVFGAADALVPVTASLAVFERELGGRGLLTTVVIPGADHRMRVGDPPHLASGYLETIADWILDITTRRRLDLG